MFLQYFEKEINAEKFGRTWKSSFKIDQLFYFSPREKEISIKEEETSQDWNGIYIWRGLERFGHPFLPKNLIRCERRYVKSIQMFLNLIFNYHRISGDLILSLFSDDLRSSHMPFFFSHLFLLVLFLFTIYTFYIQIFVHTVLSAMKIKFNFVLLFFLSRIFRKLLTIIILIHNLINKRKRTYK